MLISEFAREAGLSTDTVRYYVRRGLLEPKQGRKGGRNPYQIFSHEDLEVARLVRVAQELGLTLKEIGSFIDDERAGRLTDAQIIELLKNQRAALMRKAAEYHRLCNYLDAKIAWMSGNRGSTAPNLSDYLRESRRSAVVRG